MIFLPIGSNHGFRLVHIRTGKVAQKLKMDIKNEGFLRSKTAESPCCNKKTPRWTWGSVIEAEVCPDHIHMLVEIPPKMAVSGFVGYLKGKSSTLIYEQFGELKYKYKNRSFWCKGYYVDTVGKNTGRIAEYMRNQLEEDKLEDQLSIAEVGYLSKKKK